MATKTIAWATGSGNITLTYTGQGNGSISVASDENDSFDDRSQSFDIVTTAGTPEKALSILVKQKGKSYAAGTVFNFDYTGKVQEITLPKGKYKLQCWGAQGGTSYGSSNGAGSKGGYSEGVLTLTEKTTLYVFVGGRGSRGSSSSLVNGGWNGGGASVGYSGYNSGGTNGYSYPACGGGATDISTVTSTMSYSNGRTNRSSASLLSRCIVAGGGAGGSWRETTVITSGTSNNNLGSSSPTINEVTDQSSYNGRAMSWFTLEAGKTYKCEISYGSGVTVYTYGIYNSAWDRVAYENSSFTCNTSGRYFIGVFTTAGTGNTVTTTLYEVVSTTSSNTTSGASSKNCYGGGVKGGGQFPGTQTYAGEGGASDFNGGFGYGANQKTTNYRYASGAAGGGWYGGGTTRSDNSTSYISYTGGGSGFVNTSANASSRPSGYTGLQLDSGTTTAGNSSHPSTSGGTEKGHSGNGYARITVVE